MEDRLNRLERSNRWLHIAVVALLALNAWAVMRPATPTSAPQLLQRANAGSMETIDDVSKKPAIVMTTSTSGATLWMYELQKNGTYKRLGFGH